MRPEKYHDYVWIHESAKVFWIKHVTKLDCRVMCPRSGIVCDMSASSVRRKFIRVSKSTFGSNWTRDNCSKGGRASGLARKKNGSPRAPTIQHLRENDQKKGCY